MTRSCRTWTPAGCRSSLGRPAAGAAASELVGLHRDLDAAHATLSAAWQEHLARSRTSSRPGSPASSAGSTRVASRLPRQRTSRTRATTSGGCCTTPASRRGSSTRRSSSRCSSSASASRTPPTGRRRARATCGAATSTARGFERAFASTRPRAVAFVGKEAYRGLFDERPELGPQLRTHRIDRRSSCSPRRRLRMPPFRTRSGCAGSASCARGSSPIERQAVRGARPRRRAARAPGAIRAPGERATAGGRRPAAASIRVRATRRRCGASCARRRVSKEFELGPVVHEREHTFPWDARHPAPARSASTSCASTPRAAADDRPSRRRVSPRPALVDARGARAHRRENRPVRARGARA